MAAQIDVSFSDRLSEDRVSDVTTVLLHSLYFPVTSVSSSFSRGCYLSHSRPLTGPTQVHYKEGGEAAPQFLHH